jgi:hypothetical protein
MAVEYLAGNARSWNAGADLSAVKYRFVKEHSTAEQIVLCGAGEAAVGVVQEGRPAGQACAVLRSPASSKMTAGATLTAGQTVASGALGVAVPWVAGYAVNGWADTASVTSGIVTVTLATFGGTS